MTNSHPTPASAGLAFSRAFFGALSAGLIALLTPLALAADAPKKSFDIPAGEASATLKQFTMQAGQQLLYTMDAVKGVTSHAVKGRMSARQALDQMFAGTDLKVLQDGSNGALSLVRAPDPNGQRAAQTTASDRPIQKQNNITRAGEPATGDEPITLSPFVVSSEQSEDGYRATHTLAGMRVKSDLKDVGAAIDVLTETFLNDVGVTNMNDALSYVPNMEYNSFSALDPNNNTQFFDASYKSRGVIGNTVLTDYFPTGSLPIDRYNTDNLTFLRGPNSILFGIGSPAGIVGASSKRALLSKNQFSLRHVTDTYGSQRAEWDASYAILKNKFAVRFAAVAQDRKAYQEPSRNRRNAVYGTVTYRPFSRTAITFSTEAGVYERLHNLSNIVADAYTPWVLAGRPTVNWQTGKGQNAPGKGQFSTAIGRGLQNLSPNSYLTYIEGAGLPIMDWRNMARGATWNNTVPAGNPGSGLILNADRDLMASIPFNRGNAIVDLNANIFGWRPTNDMNYRSKSLFIEQNVVRHLDVELAWNRFAQDYHYSPFGFNPTITVDPNELLPDGRPNPYVGMPYVESGPIGIQVQRELRDFTNKRGTVSYVLELDDKKIFRHIGLGNYRFAGLVEQADVRTKIVYRRLVNVTPLPGIPTANSLNQAQNLLNRRYYLRPGESYYRTDGTESFVQATTPGATTSGPLRFEERGSSAVPRHIVRGNRSYVAAVQGAWWQSGDGYHRLTGLYGWREDAQSNNAQTFARTATGEFTTPFRDFTGLENAGVWGAETGFIAHTKSYNLTLRPFTWLRFVYNYSDIFQVSPNPFLDVFGNPMRSTYGDTRDYGVKLDLWGERIFLALTKYKTTVFDQNLNNQTTAIVRDSINNIYNAIDRSDLVLVRPSSYQDDTSTGYECTLTANLTRNWRARFTLGTQETVVSAAFEDWVVYQAQNMDLWRSFASTPVVNPSAGFATVADAIALVNQRLNDARAVIGQEPTDQRGVNSSFNTNYSFSSGRLNG
ncbi:MAG: TonB-dependent receptor plug domain-containing protein, partial [Opitutaceae bacterium]